MNQIWIGWRILRQSWTLCCLSSKVKFMYGLGVIRDRYAATRLWYRYSCAANIALSIWSLSNIWGAMWRYFLKTCSSAKDDSLSCRVRISFSIVVHYYSLQKTKIHFNVFWQHSASHALQWLSRNYKEQSTVTQTNQSHLPLLVNGNTTTCCSLSHSELQ